MLLIPRTPTAIDKDDEDHHKQKREKRDSNRHAQTRGQSLGRRCPALKFFIHSCCTEQFKIGLSVNIGSHLVAYSCIGTTCLTAYAQQTFGNIVDTRSDIRYKFFPVVNE